MYSIVLLDNYDNYSIFPANCMRAAAGVSGAAVSFDSLATSVCGADFGAISFAGAGFAGATTGRIVGVAMVMAGAGMPAGAVSANSNLTFG